MAWPMNPLDVYKGYTYHFELHVARSWEALEDELNGPSEAVTTPYAANGTLLINTRKDAHQTIDNVHYMYHNPRVDPTGTTAAVADLRLTVTEPNGTFFIHKLQNALTDMDVTDLQRSCVFLLKIVFVGRYGDNTIVTDELAPICIPLQLINIDADFTYKGGTYGMEFSAAGAGTISNNYRKLNSISGTDGYSHKNVAIKARTVREALEELQNILNRNYEEVYQLNEVEGRNIRYEIRLDPDLDGDLNLVTKDSWAPDDLMKITFQPEIPIIEMIKRIVMSSKEINDMIAESTEGLREEFHPGVRYPTYSMRYHLTEDEAVIIYEVQLYEGDRGMSMADYEFDFLFANPAGLNVDVIRFEMKYTSLLGWLQWSLNNSVAYHTNLDNETNTAMPAHYRDNILRENRKGERHVDQTGYNFAFGVQNKPMDVKPAPGANVRENAGHVPLTHEGAQAARLAFNTVAEMHGARDPQLTFQIRGHYDLLLPCIPTPNGTGIGAQSGFGFGQQASIWIKVNIKNQDGQEFFYTGYYELLTIENTFEGGQFTQNLTVIMKNRIDGVNTPEPARPGRSQAQATPVGETGRGEASINTTIATPNVDPLGNVIN